MLHASTIVIFVLTFALLGLLLGYAASYGRQTENPNGNVLPEEPPAIELPVSIVLGSSSRTTDAFSPNPVNIKVGDTIVWTNNDTQPHTVTSGSNAQPDGKFDSSPNFNPIMAPEATFSHTFTVVGEFPYYCGLHPNMVGTVVVSDSSSTIGITVKTDKPSYGIGEVITITGQLTVSDGIITQPLIIQVADSEGNLVRLDQVDLTSDGTYSYQFTAGGLINIDGTYTVSTSYKEKTEKTTFQFATDPDSIGS